MRVSIWVLTFSLSLGLCGALKVLVYQTVLGRSHVGHAGSVVDALAEKGHVVDFLMQMWNPHVSINGTKRARHVWRVELADSPWLRMLHMADPFQSFRVTYHDETFDDTRVAFCEALLENRELLATLKKQAYDIVVSSTFDSCGFGLTHLLEVPVAVGISAIPLQYYLSYNLGIPAHPSYFSDDLQPRGFGDTMTLTDRWENIKFMLENWWHKESYYRREQRLFDTRFPGFPSLERLRQMMAYMFVNTNEIIDLSKPISNKIQYIGGIALREVKPLDEKFSALLARRPKGVILFSFGSIAKTTMLPLAAKRAFLEAFAHFPEHTVLWKYDDADADELIRKNYSNVEPVDWLPQRELLADARVKLFISHMGLNSFIEAAHAGVPMVAMPLFADQAYNTQCARQTGTAVWLDKRTLSTATIVSAISTVLKDPKYTLRAQEIAAILAASPVTPKQTFVTRVELAATFPRLKEILHLRVAEVSLVEFFLLDLLAVGVVYILVGALSAVFLFKGLRKLF